MSETQTTVTGPRWFQMRAAVAAIKLESKGLRHSRGSVRTAWARHLGLPARATHAEVIAELDRLAPVPEVPHGQE